MIGHFLKDNMIKSEARLRIFEYWENLNDIQNCLFDFLKQNRLILKGNNITRVNYYCFPFDAYNFFYKYEINLTSCNFFYNSTF